MITLSSSAKCPIDGTYVPSDSGTLECATSAAGDGFLIIVAALAVVIVVGITFVAALVKAREDSRRAQHEEFG